MSESLSTWLKDILPHTPGVVRTVARRELIQAAKEFFRESYAWRATLDAVDVTQGVTAYTAASPVTNVDIHQILDIEFNGLPLRGIVDRPRGERPTGTPTQWYSTGTDTFELWPEPVQTDAATMIVRVALVPSDDLDELPDAMYRRYKDAVEDGTLGRLFSHPAKPYSNPTMATYHLTRFREAIGYAAAQGKQGNINGQNWTFPCFGK